jgi:hypothetical protein
MAYGESNESGENQTALMAAASSAAAGGGGQRKIIIKTAYQRNGVWRNVA